jgi:3-phosphoshikimate 1-carboxyvinyltransferase
MVSRLVIQGSEVPLSGGVPIAGDQEVLLARMALAVLSRGQSRFAFSGEQSGLSAFLGFLAEVGIQCSFDASEVVVEGVGLTTLAAPERSLDLRGEMQVAAFAIALLFGRTFEAELIVDELVAELLVPVLGGEQNLFAEKLDEREGGVRLVFVARSSPTRPAGVEVMTQGVYPWVKQAVLLIGLRCGTVTAVDERIATADHLERAMTRSRVPLSCEATLTSLHPPRDDDALSPQIYEAIGSQRLLAPLLAAALSVEGSSLTVREVGLNPTGSSALSVCRHLGAKVGISPKGDRQGEPYGDLSVQNRALRSLSLGGETMLRLGDGAFSLFAPAARATGTCVFSEIVPQRRGGDSRIFARSVGLLRQAGVEADIFEGGLRIVGNGGARFSPVEATTGGDPRLALLATCLSLGAKGQSVVDDVDCLRAEFPRWVGTLRALGAQIRVENA